MTEWYRIFNPSISYRMYSDENLDAFVQGSMSNVQNYQDAVDTFISKWISRLQPPTLAERAYVERTSMADPLKKFKYQYVSSLYDMGLLREAARPEKIGIDINDVIDALIQTDRNKPDSSLLSQIKAILDYHNLEY